MKKILFTIAIVITMTMGVNAQHDGFFTNNYEDNGFRGYDTPGVPTGVAGSILVDQDAPLGAGLFILTALGTGYALSKRRKS